MGDACGGLRLRIYNDFQQAQIPIEWVNANSDSRNYNPDEQTVDRKVLRSLCQEYLLQWIFAK